MSTFPLASTLPSTNEIDVTKPPCSWSADAELKQYTGGCHCGKFAYAFEHPEITKAMDCNCSLCKMRGGLFIFTKKELFKFTKGSFEELTGYEFNTKRITHYFCPTCGVPFVGRGWVVGVNVRSVEGLDLKSLQLIARDGASL